MSINFKESSVSTHFVWRSVLLRLGHVVGALVFTLSLGACSGDSWKEEVLLHDGQKIIVERSQTYKGNSEIGQPTPVGEHTIRFRLPGTDKQIIWTSEYGEDLGRTNFNLVALHVLKNEAFLVAVPNLCLSYNKWGRPNPPYVLFRHDGGGWRRIPMQDLPNEFGTVNLIVNDSRQNDIKKSGREAGFVPAIGVREINSSLEQAEYKAILREPMQSGLCPQYSSGPKPPIPLASASAPK